MTLSQLEVVAAAVRLLDRAGLEGLTLRKLAAELGVSAPTLYWHVDDKRHLLDLMVEEIYQRAEVRPAPERGEPWWRWLAANARAQRQALLSIRDAALVVAGNRPTRRSLPYIERTLQSLVAAGLDAPTGLRLLRSLNDYVVGSAIEQQSMMARLARPERDAETAQAMTASAEFPVLHAALTSTDENLDEIFEAGLRWFIDGVRTDVAARARAVAPGATAQRR
jgi:TetR/AcrR family tetracycline transcriptional repressor